MPESPGGGDSEESTILGDDHVLVGSELCRIGDPHVGSKRERALHDLVDAGWGMFDDDGPVRGFGLDPGAGTEELALEPRSTGGSDDQQRSGGE